MNATSFHVDAAGKRWMGDISEVESTYGRPEYYNRNGDPISLVEWGHLMETDKIVARTQINDDVSVSTVWLGMDHSFGADSGPPTIFETMVFGDDDVPDDQWRYATEAEAVQGHNTIVANMRYQHGAGKRVGYQSGGSILDPDPWINPTPDLTPKPTVFDEYLVQTLRNHRSITLPSISLSHPKLKLG